MSRDTNSLISELVEHRQPVRPLLFSRGLALALAGLAATFAMVAGLFNLRPDVLAGNPAPVFVIATGLFFLLGLASAVSVIAMGRPSVGTDHGGWKWSAAMAGLLPLAALVTVIGHPAEAVDQTAVISGLKCLGLGSMLGLLTFAVLIWWLRRGAPTSPERAGLLTGIAAGSFGIFAFSFHCPYDDIVHIGLWHGLVVVVSAAIGRAVVPGLIRW